MRLISDRLDLFQFIMFILFTLLYLIIEFEINLLILLKKASVEKVLLTLPVTIEMHFSLQNSLKISCMVLSKCM